MPPILCTWPQRPALSTCTKFAPADSTNVPATIGLPIVYLITETRATARRYVSPTNRIERTPLFVSKSGPHDRQSRFHRFVIVEMGTGFSRPGDY
jgi:hypothetical protein